MFVIKRRVGILFSVSLALLLACGGKIYGEVEGGDCLAMPDPEEACAIPTCRARLIDSCSSSGLLKCSLVGDLRECAMPRGINPCPSGYECKRLDLRRCDGFAGRDSAPLSVCWEVSTETAAASRGR